MEANDSAISVFSDNYDLKSLIKKPTCNKNPNTFLTNKPQRFEHSCVVGTGLPDFRKMAVTAIKTSFEKLQMRVVSYRKYKYFENHRYRTYFSS